MPMPTETLTILLVEDNPRDACWVQEQLQEVEAFSFQLIRVSQLEDALNCLTQIPSISVILLELPLPDAEGVGIVRQMLDMSPDIPIVVISSWSEEAIALQALEYGAQDYLVKNQVDGEQLVRAISYAIARHKAKVPRRDERPISRTLCGEVVNGYQQVIHCPSNEQTWICFKGNTIFRTLYESISAAVILLDETVVCDGNSAALQMFGCTEREQLCGNRINQFSPPVQPQGKNSVDLAQQYISCAIAQGGCRFDWLYRKRTGEEFPAEVTLTRIELGNRKLLQAVIYDISDRKATEMQLLQAKEAAEAGSRAKSEFLATISHELRTPLNAVLGLSQLLRQEIHGRLNEQQKEYIRCIQSSGEHLLALINDILDLSKVEAGKEQLTFAPIDIQQMCEYCLAMVREQANERGLKLTLCKAPEARLVIADERRCKQMLLNLLSNAVKFTLVGEVALIVTKQAEGICFTVQDTGIGIATEQLPLLFEPFRQLDSGLNRQFPGTGLGLALTRSLARLHGGDVRVESTLGYGSAFTLCLPDCFLEERMLSSALQVPGMIEGESCPLWAKFRILLVETDQRSALVLKDYLQVIGHRVEHLTDGQDFLSKVRTFKPNLILMDAQLQEDCTGLDLLALLRREPDTKNLKVVMMSSTAKTGEGGSYSLDTTVSRLNATASCLSANTNGGRPLLAQSGRSLNASRECCLEAGADDCLIKPIGIAQLEAILMRYL
jgi:PAS domain S-box-containing protein